MASSTVALARPRHEYVLTSAGADLAPVLLALMQWGDRQLTGERGPALHAHHHGCGAPNPRSSDLGAGQGLRGKFAGEVRTPDRCQR
ncbi:winged helix-turn-helix transcriptional regulator [Catellatospora paridis]|uniref:winged helix-turn-helix transcriptional regulator n=1 Tax=Catellatospora paridis TaxID=1617086 RepID=UPI0012D3A5E0|nr:winged helix-turn-helix transcriptional regulator [Catellatospora paridis]